MSANVEWDIPFAILSSKGTLTLNDDANSDGLFLLIPDDCDMGRDLRVTVDEIPQAKGQINHARFTTGYEARLTVALWENRGQPACGQQLRLMQELLMLHLNDLLIEDGRLFWTPTGLGGQRILDEAMLRAISRPTLGPAGDSRMGFTLDSVFPYVYDFTQEIVALPANTPVVVENEGTEEFRPVVKVDGPAASFSIENVTTGRSVEYDSSLPGATGVAGGNYIEFDFFRDTAYLNGTGASMKPGIDVLVSDFWSLEARVPNTIQIVGAGGTILYNHAYA